MTVLFLAQVFGVDLSITTQLVVVVMSVITAVGVAGVPGGSIPLLVMVLEMVGVPGAGIALILGVDRILDMARTVPNVMGDLLTSLVVTRVRDCLSSCHLRLSRNSHRSLSRRLQLHRVIGSVSRRSWRGSGNAIPISSRLPRRQTAIVNKL